MDGSVGCPHIPASEPSLRPPPRGRQRLPMWYSFTTTFEGEGMEQTDFLPYEKPTPPGTHVKPIPRDLFIQHDVCVETRWESMYGRGYVTPASLFYIRNHGPTPTIDVKTWRLKVQGPGVAKPLELSYDDILRMPSVTCDPLHRVRRQRTHPVQGVPGRHAQGQAMALRLLRPGRVDRRGSLRDPGARRHQAHRRRRHAHGPRQVGRGAPHARRQGHGAGHSPGVRHER